eukprot:jgi/Mesen1/2282/ME000154S01459
MNINAQLTAALSPIFTSPPSNPQNNLSGERSPHHHPQAPPLIPPSSPPTKLQAADAPPTAQHQAPTERQVAPGEVPRRKLGGEEGLEVSAEGLGCMGMSAFYGPPKPEAAMEELIRAAVEMGVTFFDTADVYGPHTNERLLGKSIKGIRDKVQIATKFGLSMDEMGRMKQRGDPAYVRQSCEGSLARLEVDCIDLYYLHRVDPTVPIEVTVRHLGLSEASADTIRRAHAVHAITAVQMEWSLWSRDVEDDIVPTCSPLGRGFFSGGATSPEHLHDSDWRKTQPRFVKENLDKNKVLYERVKQMADDKGCTPGQLALAWVLHHGDNVVPIPGTTNLDNLKQNIQALKVQLTPGELADLAGAVPASEVAGERYSEDHIKSTWRFVDTPPLSSWQG